MACEPAVFWDPELTSYDFGPGHPLAPVRVELTMKLASAFGILSGQLRSFSAATDEELATVHDSRYIAAVRRNKPDSGFGIGTADNPVFYGMHEASALVAGASIAAARAITSGQAAHAVNISGGLHHAMRDHASGFCIYNDPALAIARMLSEGVTRVAYVDVDVHHGDGVQAAFYDDPRVLTISLHEHPATLFPGTGLSTETGAGAGRGYAVNVPLPPGTGDAGWLRAFEAIVPPLLRAFKPVVLVSQHGCDTHRLDPLAHLELSLDAQRLAQARLHDLAHEVTEGRWLATGGGGYSLVQVVPRCWTHLLAIAAGSPVPPLSQTPSGWRTVVRELTGEDAPETMTDGAPASYTPFESDTDHADAVDLAIRQTRDAIFHVHGLSAT